MKKNEKYGEGMNGFSSKLFKLVLTLLLVVCATGVKAISFLTQFTIEGVTYTQIQEGVNTVSVTGYDLSESTALIIPDKVTNETTEYTVTSIGASAFINCRKLTSVTIPSSVTSIGDNAFNTSSLTSVTIPSSVTSIGTDAFANCDKLATVTEGYLTYTIADTKATVTGWVNSPTALTVPSEILGGAYSVTGIGTKAFEKCYSLTSVSIPSSVTTIGDEAFSSCISLASITVDDANTFYSSTDGVLFSEDKKTLIFFPISHKDAGTTTATTSYTILEGVTSIGAKAFEYCTNLTSVSIPNSVTTIGNHAFNECAKLNTAPIPSNVTSIGNYAFSAH